jgi:peptidoglycan/LPS O-acetylase OafA/YrhL
MAARYQLLDSLRALAAIAVAMYHYFGYFAQAGVPQSAWTQRLVAATSFGHFGVEVFFVISGFVIAMTADRVPFTPRAGGRFLARRMVRLVPPYWAMIGVIVVYHVAGKAAGYFATTTVTSVQVAANLLYLQDLLGYASLSVIFWTLCLEVQFYIVYVTSAIALRWLAPNRKWAAEVGWFAALGLVSGCLAVTGQIEPKWFLASWYQFAAGVLVYLAARRAGGGWLAAAVVGGLTVLEGYRQTGAAGVCAATAGLIYLAARWELWGAWLDKTGLTTIGRRSYSLYLCHGFVGGLVYFRLRNVLGLSEATVWAMIGLMVLGAIGATWLLYDAAERPAMRWSKRIQVTSTPAKIGGRLG